jgi:hypothetical protein
MLNENNLSKDILKDRKNEQFVNMKIDTSENCELESQTDAFKFVKALSAMKGTYTKQCGTQYTFIHDSMFEICARQYGQQFPDQMLLYMSSSYVANYVKPQTSGQSTAKKEKQSDCLCSVGDKSRGEKRKPSDPQSSVEGESRDKKRKQNDPQSSVGDESRGEKRKHSDSQSSVGGESRNKKQKRNEGDENDDDSHEIEEGSDDENNEVGESFDLCIRLREDQYPLLAQRLYRDIQNMELYDVFRNQVLKHPQVCQAFIGELETKSYTELKNLFLYSQGKVDKIQSKRECVEEEGDEREKWDEWLRQWVLVGGMYDSGVRVISWVVYYGYHQILQYIVQQTQQHNDISELFGVMVDTSHQSKSGMSTSDEQDSIEDDNHYIRLYKRSVVYNRQIEENRLLLLGIYSGDVQTVRVLLPHICKETVNGRRYPDTPLTAACKGGNVSVVEELVKAGADVNLQDDDGNTPLIAACEGGHVSVVTELVKAGADVNLQDDDGNTPLIAACEGGHVSVVT